MRLAQPGTIQHSKPHFLSHFVPPSPHRWSMTSLAILLCLSIFGYITTAAQLIHSFAASEILTKDFKQEYLFATAILNGANPYVPLDQLAQAYMPEAVQYSWRHVIGHPPFIAVFVTPLGLVSYRTAALIWLIFELALLGGTAYLLVRHHTREHTITLSVALAGLLLLWPPVSQDLYFGQLNIPMCICLIGSWLAFRSGRMRLAGFLVGLATSIKLLPGVLILYFVVTHRWRAAAWAAGSAAMLTLSACAILGPDTTRAYVERGIVEGAYWRAALTNYSLAGAVSHLFIGTLDLDGRLFVFRETPIFSPLVDAPWLATPAWILLSAWVVLRTIRIVVRANDLDCEISLFGCTMILVSPVAWQHYLVLLIPSIYVVGSRLRDRAWPRHETNRFLGALVLLSMPSLVVGIVGLLLGALLSTQGTYPLPWVASIPLLLLPTGILLLYGSVVNELRVSGGCRTSWLKSDERATESLFLEATD